MAHSPDPTRRSERARQAILSAATELVGELGYRKVTIEAIAARAGVGKQTIYRWWPSKAAVVLEGFLATVNPGDLTLPDTGDVAADLRAVIRATVAELADPLLSGMTRSLMFEMQDDPDLADNLTARVLAPQLAAIADRLRAAQEAGQLRRDLDLGVAVEMFVGPLYHRWLLRTGPLTDGYADTVTDLALRALATRASTAGSASASPTS